MRWGVLILVLMTAAAARGAEQPTTKLTGTIVDLKSGEPLPARLSVRSSTGKWHVVKTASTAGSALEYRKLRGTKSLEVHTTLSAHPFVVELPPGKYTFVAERGKEYHTTTKIVDVGTDPVAIQLGLRRWTDMAALGWFSGDTHVHRTLDELPNVMLAEDLNVALPLTQWVTKSDTPPTKGDKNTDGGGPPKLIRIDDTHVVWPLNTEYEIFTVGPKRHTLGAVFILNHRQPFELGTPPVAPIAQEARRQKAILDLDKHSWPWSLMLVPTMKVDLFELTNNHVWRTDFHFKRFRAGALPEFLDVETDDEGMTERGWVDFGFGTYYALLNCGFRMRPTAGTASGVHPVSLGFGRVYVYAPTKGKLDYGQWIKGLDAGNSFITTGPMLPLRFNKQLPGHTFSVKAGETPSCKITGAAESARPLSKIEIIVNGEVRSRVKPLNRKTAKGGFTSPLDISLELDGSSWVAVRCESELPNGRFRFAHTAPVHFDVAGQPLRPKQAEVRYFVRRMEEELVNNRGVLKPAALAEYQKALEAYREIAKRAR